MKRFLTASFVLVTLAATISPSYAGRGYYRATERKTPVKPRQEKTILQQEIRINTIKIDKTPNSQIRQNSQGNRTNTLNPPSIFSSSESAVSSTSSAVE